MQRVYLLLRNNKQSGPHSFEDLQQMGLQPFDLIWVEGRSQAWRYPSEIDSLKTLLPGTIAATEAKPAQQALQPVQVAQPRAVHRHIFVSMPNGRTVTATPKDEIEERATALRQRVAQLETAHGSNLNAHTATTHYTRSMDEVSEDYGSWLYQAKAKKKKRLNAGYLAVGLVVAAGLGGGWLLGRQSLNMPSLTLSRQESLQAKADPPAANIQNNMARTAVDETSPDSAALLLLAATDSVVQIKTGAIAQKARPTTEKRNAKSNQNKIPVAVAQQPVPAETEEQLKPAAQTPVAETTETTATTPEAPVKKKGGFFARLFGKKEKEKEKPQPEVEKTKVDLSHQVKLQLKENGDNWMMGIQGYRMSLRNESSTELKTAAIEISYFSEQDALLEKKTIYFSNVGSRKSKTIAVPDHRTAGKVSYHLLNASGEAEAYVKQ